MDQTLTVMFANLATSWTPILINVYPMVVWCQIVRHAKLTVQFVRSATRTSGSPLTMNASMQPVKFPTAISVIFKVPKFVTNAKQITPLFLAASARAQFATFSASS